jgi:hypothetical protein
MYSYSHFTPGTNQKCGRVITYDTIMNSISTDPNNIITYNNCNNNNIKKNSSFQQVSDNLSTKQRQSQIITSSVGGRVQFGNYYLGQPVVANYLGNYQGQPGGSGAPLRNRF